MISIYKKSTIKFLDRYTYLGLGWLIINMINIRYSNETTKINNLRSQTEQSTNVPAYSICHYIGKNNQEFQI